MSTGPTEGPNPKKQRAPLAGLDDCRLIEARTFDDDRGRRALELFDSVVPGEVDLTWAYPGRVVAWHRHRLQTDLWFVVKGQLKIGLMSDDGRVRWEYLGEQSHRILSIPPGIWHGYMVLGESEAVLLYYLTRKRDHKTPDEERMSIQQAGVDWSVRPR